MSDPRAGVDILAAVPSIASVAGAVNVKTAPVALVASTVAFAGTVTTGPVVSVTVTVNDAALVLPCASVAAQVTVVAPNGNVEPLAGVRISAMQRKSGAVGGGGMIKIKPVALVASTGACAGTVTIGPVVSVTVSVN